MFALHTYIFVLHAHLVRGESHNQRNTTGEVATNLCNQTPLFTELRRLQATFVLCLVMHILCVNALKLLSGSFGTSSGFF